MLSIEQCRGARGILGWTQQQLADASGLSKTAINNFEKGHSDIKAESLKAIRSAFEVAGIELLEYNGLRKKTEDMKILRGVTSHAELWVDIEKSICAGGPDILFISPQEFLLNKMPKDKLRKYQESLKNHNMQQRIICGSQYPVAPAIVGVGYLPQEQLSAATTAYIYGSKVAFELWEDSAIVIVASHDVQEAERKRFEHLWNMVSESPERILDSRRAG